VLDFHEPEMVGFAMATFWTDNICPIAGTYESDCDCASVIALRAGEDFPTCAECSQAVSWELLAAAAAEPARVRR
jgi:hypothetical protein